jgi:hypothetical protein
MFGKNKVFPFNGLHAPVVMAIAAVGSFISSQQAASAQKDSIAAQKKIADAQAAKERIQTAREARIRRAQILASTGNQGVGAASSGPAGAVSSIGSQLGSNIANINTIQNYAQQASKANQQAADAQAMGAMWQGIGNISGSMTDWTKIFNRNGIGQYPGAPIVEKSR